jgi:hypothetical protein
VGFFSKNLGELLLVSAHALVEFSLNKKAFNQERLHVSVYEHERVEKVARDLREEDDKR